MDSRSGPTNPRIVSIGTANPPRRYTQEEILALFGDPGPRIRSLFLSSHINTRHLLLPEPRDGVMPVEDQATLLDKHRQGALLLGPQAIRRCLDPLGVSVRDIDFLVCISSTGYLCPGISAFLIREMGFREDVHRADILGMGCNAGVNGLNTVVGWARSNPGRKALMVCVEVCSAAYVADNSMATAVVNSLFGDGAAAILVEAHPELTAHNGPQVLGFDSQIVTDAIHTMRFGLDGSRLSFFLDKDIPYVIGQNVYKPVGRLLKKHGLRQRQIEHWVVHSGGKKVIDSIKYNLGLTAWDMRHTESILRDYGNLSSGAFLFSYQELLREGLPREGDLGVAIAMGPGASIETALLRW